MARTKGTKDLTPRKKAVILAKKNTKQFPLADIAASEGVSLKTARNITHDAVPPEVRKMAEEYEEQFLIYAKANALKAAQKVFVGIDELSADKAVVVAEKSFNMSQIIQSKPTAITQKSEYERALDLFLMLARELSHIAVEARLERVKVKFADIDEAKLITDAARLLEGEKG